MEWERRPRKRRAPGAKPGDCRRCSAMEGRCCSTVPAARPLPVALFLATVVAAGTGTALAFTVSIVPMGWPSLAGLGRPQPGNWKSCWQEDGMPCIGPPCSDGLRTRNFESCRGKSRLSATGPIESESGTTVPGTTSSKSDVDGSYRKSGDSVRRRHLEESDFQEQSRQRTRSSAAAEGVTLYAQPKETGRGISRNARGSTSGRRWERTGGRGWKRGRGRKGIALTRTNTQERTKSGGEEEMQLSELMKIESVDSEDLMSPSATNKTELSQKVEAELFGEYDAMVPGPPASLIAVGATDGDPNLQQERTGRPLAINLDLLSYHAKQKAIKGKHSEARALYRRCVKLDPRDGRGWLGLARQMERLNKFDKAQTLFELGLENCPDNPFLLQAFAVMEEGRGNQAKALTLLNRSVRRNPHHTASWVALGLLNERNKRINEARACFQKATKSDPTSHYAWMVWALLEKRYGSIDTAREKFKTCLRVNPKNAKTYQAWGVLETEEGNFSLAAELFRAGLEQRAGNTFIMQAWALMEVKRRDVDAAKKLLDEALHFRPQDGAVWQAYALMYKDRRDFEGARSLFQQGVYHAPKHCPLWQAWAMMEWQLGDSETARRLFQEGVWENPKGASAVRILQAWAILEATEYNFIDARKYFGFALARDPYSVPVMVAWALMEEDLGDIARARQLLEIAASTESGNPNIWNVYEQVEARRGFKAEAKAVHERGIRTVAAATSAGNTGPNAWWDKSVKPLSQPPALGGSLIDQASRSLSTSSAEMAQRVSRIIGGVQWASDYMSFTAATNHGSGGEVALEP